MRKAENMIKLKTEIENHIYNIKWNIAQKKALKGQKIETVYDNAPGYVILNKFNYTLWFYPYNKKYYSCKGYWGNDIKIADFE